MYEYQVRVITASCFRLLSVNGGCKTSSIDARKTKTGVPYQEQISSTSQLTDQDVFGNELTLEIT